MIKNVCRSFDWKENKAKKKKKKKKQQNKNNKIQQTIFFCFRWLWKVKLATLVEGGPQAPFLIATTPKCRRGRYSIPWIAPLYPWSLPDNAECYARRHQLPFLNLWYDSTRIETRSPGLSANSQLFMPIMAQCVARQKHFRMSSLYSY